MDKLVMGWKEEKQKDKRDLYTIHESVKDISAVSLDEIVNVTENATVIDVSRVGREEGGKE